MSFSPLLLISLFIAAAFLLIGLIILLKNRWLFGWLIGCLGLLSLSIGGVALLLSVDILNYRMVEPSETLGTISFKEIRAQEFDVKYTNNFGVESSFIVYGDLIQLKGDLLTIPQIFNRLGFGDMIRLDEAFSRYISLIDEQNKPHTAFSIPFKFNSFGFDTALIFDRFSLSNPYINIEQIDTPFHEITDGGIYFIAIDQQKSLKFIPAANHPQVN